MKKFIVIALFLAMSAVAPALDLGDQALPISPESWVTGDEADPTKVDDKTFFLVEVWSTTCPPCVRSIPILNDLQKRYADQGFKIVSFTTDTREEIEPFLKQHPMEYSSFIDKEGATYINYMAADNRNTIPHAFLFDKSGILVWIGNPLDNVEGKIKQVLDGTLNGAGAMAIREARDGLQAAFETQDVDGMLIALKRLQGLEPDNVQYYQLHLRILAQFGSPGDDVATLFKSWYDGCKDSAEGLVVLAVMALEQMHPDQRYPGLAVAAAKRAYAIGGDHKLEAGITLAETYKDVGRLDLAMQTLDEIITLTDDSEEKEIITAIANFYKRAKEVGENPDADFAP